MEQKKGNRKFLLVLTIIILIGSICFLAYRFIGSISLNNDDDFFDFFNQQEFKNNISKSSFNAYYEAKAGKKSGFFLTNVVDEVITSNKKYPEKLIEFVVDGVSYGTEESSIYKVYELIDENKDYYVSLNYDDEGYVNKITLITQ